MSSIYRKLYTKSLPAGAELFTRQGRRFAKWKTSKGKTRTAPVTTGTDGSDRIVSRSRTFFAKYRDGQGIVRSDVPTGCHDEQSARAVLSDLVGRAQLVKAKVMSPSQASAADHADTPLERHLADYLAWLRVFGNKGRGACAKTLYSIEHQFRRVMDDCRFRRLSDLRRDAFEQWLMTQHAKGMSARTRNTYRATLYGFANWCARRSSPPRLSTNPFADVVRADQKTNRCHVRRSMTEVELIRLLSVAQNRPLAEYGRKSEKIDPKQRKRQRDTWRLVPLTFETMDEAVERARDKLKDSPDFIAELETMGRERALIYKTLVLTGLRKGELASVTIGQVQLEGDMPSIQLNAGAEKNRQGNSVPLRADLVADLSQWLGDRLETLYGPSKRFVGPMREALPPDMRLFDVPAGLVRILDRDLKAAGIPKVDDRGRVLDVHALRTTFGTLLSKGGVSLRTAQEAMRHSDPKLTANVYTDPKLLDIAGALEALPMLSLDVPSSAEAETMKATGTTDEAAGSPAEKLAPILAPTLGERGHFGGNAGISDGFYRDDATNEKPLENLRKTRVSKGICVTRRGGLEPPTFGSVDRCSIQLS